MYDWELLGTCCGALPVASGGAFGGSTVKAQYGGGCCEASGGPLLACWEGQLATIEMRAMKSLTRVRRAGIFTDGIIGERRARGHRSHTSKHSPLHRRELPTPAAIDAVALMSADPVGAPAF